MSEGEGEDGDSGGRQFPGDGIPGKRIVGIRRLPEAPCAVSFGLYGALPRSRHAVELDRAYRRRNSGGCQRRIDTAYDLYLREQMTEGEGDALCRWPVCEP